jgi:hypothetical protein
LHRLKRKRGTRIFWSGLMDAKNLFLARGRFMVGDGSQTRFWEDRWIGDELLMKKYPSLYNIARSKNVRLMY